MKVGFTSDTHIDFWVDRLNPQHKNFDKQVEKYIKNILQPENADVLIIAGDLGHYFQQDTAVLKKLKQFYKHILLVVGNHDMYLVSKKQQSKYLYDSYNRVLEMKKFCRENDGFHLMDGDTIVIDGYKFGGTGMSWDGTHLEVLTGENPSEGTLKELFYDTMNDANLIFGGGENYDYPTAYGGRHRIRTFDPFSYFKSQYEKLQEIESGLDVMITHYAPLLPTETKYFDKKSTAFYYFDGRKDIKRIKPKYWFFGHMHDKFDFMYDETHFLCNPIAYPGENSYSKIEHIIL